MEKKSLVWAGHLFRKQDLKKKIIYIYKRLLTQGVKTEEMGISIRGSKLNFKFAGRLTKLTEIAGTQPLIKKHI